MKKKLRAVHSEGLEAKEYVLTSVLSKDDFDLVLSKLRAEESGRGKASDKAVSSDEKARQEQLRLEKLEVCAL